MFEAKLIELSNAGARAVRLRRMGGLSILTMQRAVTSTEANYEDYLLSSRLPAPAYNDSSVAEYRKFYTPERINGLHSGGNENFIRDRRELRPFALRNQDRIKIFRPIVSPEVILSWNNVRALIELGVHSNYDVIIIPDSFSQGDSEYAKIVLKARKYCEDEISRVGLGNIEAVPSAGVYNDLELFKAKVKFAAKEGFPLLNIDNRYYPSHYPQYSFLKDFSAKAENICIYGSNVPRLHRANWRTSGIHLYSAFGQDILSQEIRPSFLPEGKRNVHDDPKRKFRLFDPNEDALIKRGEYNTKYGEELIYNDNPYCTGETLTSMYNKHNNQLLAKVLKVIEFMESTKTLSSERNAVITNEYQEIMRNKGEIGRFIAKLGQRTLF